MNAYRISKLMWRFVTSTILSILLLGCSGCQTFNLTKEEWARIQKGGTADRDVGNAMDFLGMILGPAAAGGGAALAK